MCCILYRYIHIYLYSLYMHYYRSVRQNRRGPDVPTREKDCVRTPASRSQACPNNANPSTGKFQNSFTQAKLGKIL